MRRLGNEDAVSNAHGAGFATGYQHGRGHEQLEADRQKVMLNWRPPATPPELIAPTRCRVLRRFFLAGGKRAEIDAIVTLPRSDALSLEALGKVAIL